MPWRVMAISLPLPGGFSLSSIRLAVRSIFQGCIAILLVLTGTYQELYSFELFAIWAFFALTAIALIRLRRKEPALPRSYRVWGYPWTPLLFGAAAAAIAVNLWLVRPVRSSIGLAGIVPGLLFFTF